jgi:hypothetical protein
VGVFIRLLKLHGYLPVSLKEIGYEMADNGTRGKYGGRNIYSQRNRVKIHKGKAGSEMASRSLNVLKKLEKALNHKGFWPFLLRKIL